MSIYIGDNLTEKVLHLYGNSSNIEKNVISGTAFHSSLPYFKFLSIHRFYPVGDPYVVYDTAALFLDKCNYSTSTPLPAGDYNVILRGSKDGTIYTFPTNSGELFISEINEIDFGNPWGSCPAFKLDSNLTTGHTTRADNKEPGWGIFPVSKFDYIDIYVLYQDINLISPSDIKLTNSDITINGASIFTSFYIYFMDSLSDRVNDYDTIIPVPSPGSHFNTGYATSTSNLNHTFTLSGAYIQIINSYDYPITAVEISSIPSEILVTKNGIDTTLFSENKYVKANENKLNDFKAIVYGDTIVRSTTKFLRTLSFTWPAGSTAYITQQFSKSGFTTPKDTVGILPLEANKTLTIVTSYLYYVFGKVRADLSGIDFYVTSTSTSDANFVTDLYVTVHVMSI